MIVCQKRCTNDCVCAGTNLNLSPEQKMWRNVWQFYHKSLAKACLYFYWWHFCFHFFASTRGSESSQKMENVWMSTVNVVKWFITYTDRFNMSLGRNGCNTCNLALHTCIFLSVSFFCLMSKWSQKWKKNCQTKQVHAMPTEVLVTSINFYEGISILDSLFKIIFLLFVWNGKGNWYFTQHNYVEG